MISIKSDLLRQAKELNINLSQTLEQSLSEVVREAKRQRWLAENKEAIAAYNERIERDDFPLEQYRTF